MDHPYTHVTLDTRRRKTNHSLRNQWWSQMVAKAKQIVLHHSWLITSNVTKLTRRVPLVDQELLTLPEYTSSPPVLSGVPVTRSLILCVCFVDRCLSFCTFSFGYCVVCSSSMYGIWLPIGIFKLFL